MEFHELYYDLRSIQNYLSLCNVTYFSLEHKWKHLSTISIEVPDKFENDSILILFAASFMYLQFWLWLYSKKAKKCIEAIFTNNINIFAVIASRDAYYIHTHIHHVDELIWPQMKITSNKIEKTKNQDLRMVAQSISMCSLDLVLNCM